MLPHERAPASSPVADGKGLLAIDESNGPYNKLLAAAGLKSRMRAAPIGN